MSFVSVSGFKGINNRQDPTALGLEWQLSANNTLCDTTEYLIRRPGYKEFLTSVADVFGAQDGRMFVVTTGDVLLEVKSNGTTITRAKGFTGGRFEWAELGYAIFALSETTAWAIYPDRVVAWGIPVLDAPTVSAVSGALPVGKYQVACILQAPDGRQGGCVGVSSISVDTQGITVESPAVAGYTTHAYLSAPDGAVLYHAGVLASGSLTVTALPAKSSKLTTLHCYPPVLNGLVAAHANRLCIAVWEGQHDRTALYWSKPDAPHLFDLETDYQLVSGRPMLLTSAGSVLLLGTDRAIYAVPAGGAASMVAAYGALPDTAATLDEGKVAFWTEKGLCVFSPFQNLTDAHLVPDNRTYSTGTVLQHNGGLYYLCAQRGGVRLKEPGISYTPLTVVTEVPS